MRGLEGAWLMAAPNLITTSSSFAGQSSRRATWVESAATYAPGTNSKMWKLVEDDTASNTHEGLIAAGNIGAVVTASITAKAAERSHLRIYTNGGITYSQIFALSGAGSVSGGTSAGHTSTITALGDGCYRCVVAYTMSNVGLRVLLNNGSVDTYSGTGTAPYTEDDPGIYIADAQLNRGPTPLPYTATDALQTFASLYGKSPTLTRGADANAATDDPTPDGWGWVHDGTKFGRTGNLTIPISGPFTAYIVALFTGTSGYILSFGADANNYHALYNSADNAVGIASKDAGGETTSASALATVDASAILISLRSDGATLTACREDTGAEVTLAAESAAGTALLAVGSLPNGGSPVSGQTTYAAYIVGRQHNRSERQRVRRAMRAKVYADTYGGVSIL